MRTFVSFPEGYELLDAGDHFKLERWGNIVTIRPEHQAYFKPASTLKLWRERAHWEFIPQSEGSLTGVWKALHKDLPEIWDLSTQDLKVRLTAKGNKHLGLFPEQKLNWDTIRKEPATGRFLNLFAYTGMSSIVGRKHGFDVTHVDSVRGMIDAARLNMELSGLDGIRWAVEDAFKFVSREVKRASRYDLIQLDPPAWGIGKKGEKWKLEQSLPELLHESYSLLNPGGLLIVSTYSPKITLPQLDEMIGSLAHVREKMVSEIWLKSTSGKDLFYGLVGQVRKR